MRERLPFHPAALASFLGLVRRATSDNTARVVEGIVRGRACSAARSLDIKGLAETCADDVDSVRERLEEADREFRVTFGARLLGPDVRASVDADDASDADDAGGDGTLRFSAAFLDLLDTPTPLATATEAPDPDEVTASWIAVLSACPKSDRGHHLALRCLHRDVREPTDVARLAAAGGIEVRFVGNAGNLEFAVLRAELHAGAVPALVVVDQELVCETSAGADEDPWDHPSVTPSARERLSASDRFRLDLFRGLRNTYLWRAPATWVVDAQLAAFLGGAFGPVAPTRRWRDAVISDFAPGIGHVGAAALAARVDDVRDAGPLAALACVAASALDIELDEAAVFVAGSLSGVQPPKPVVPAGFDARLVVCDEEGQLLLARASHLARHGASVLFWGPPGGGKSTFAQALAGAMGRGALTVTGASILARHWGVTERIIADTWSRAADDGTTLIIDEIDSLCGVREPGASSGNAYLIRSLTNEFLRAFDAYASVPVVATANHLETIDEAIRRRFTFVVQVRGELTPEAEELAWRLVFQVEPPSAWVPIGANVSDFSNAIRRCRMLGLLDPDALAAALERSRDARLGPRPVAAVDKRVLQ